MNILSPEQFKRRLQQTGKTITEWAKDRGYSRREVYRVLNGQTKALYGRGHDIAVAAGLKPQELV